MKILKSTENLFANGLPIAVSDLKFIQRIGNQCSYSFKNMKFKTF